LAQDKEFVERFRREALSVADLSHPNILHVYDAGFSDGVYYIVMAFVDGGSLKEMIMRGPLEMEYAVSVVAQIADALHHAHQHGLVHRDVKPNNILMTRDGRPLLTDFGIAKAVHESTGLTRTGTSIGTPEYMAPEQIQGQKVDARTDIYALGIVLYEALTGWTPFSTTTPVATLYKQVNEPPPPLRQANINIPVWLEDVALKALEKSPQDRFQEADDFAEALRQHRAPERVATPAPTTVSRTQTRAEPGPKQRRKLVPLLIGGIVLLVLALVAIVAAVLLSGGGGPAPEYTRVVPRATESSAIVTPEPLSLRDGGGQVDWQVVEDPWIRHEREAASPAF
jgi:serine/threonine-protein kinase